MRANGDRIRCSRAAGLAWHVGLMFLVIATGTTKAQEKTDLSATALSIAPQDVAFFSTSVNMRAAWQEFSQGNFVTRLRQVPFVQAMEGELTRQWENPQGQLQQAKGVLESPNARNLLSLASDMFSDEVFSYGGSEWCETIEGLMDFQNRLTTAMSENPEALPEFFQGLTRQDVDRLRIPTTVIGFRLSEDENARLQLDALEGILRLGGGQVEALQPLLEKLRRADLSDGQTLTITLDTSLIPLDTLDGEQRDVAEKVVELLEGRSLSLAIGVKSNIFLLAFGEDTTVINAVGESDETLLDHPRMSVLKQADLTNLRSISFASQRWRESQWSANFDYYFRRMSAQFTVALENDSDEIPEAEQWKADIRRDAEWLDKKFGELAPEFGDMLAWSRSTASGSEGWAYDWSVNVGFENARPMEILQHAGTGSALLFAFKQRSNPAVDQFVTYILNQAPSHLRRFITAAEQNPEDLPQALEILDKVWPLVERTHAILRDKVGPALASNESLFSFGLQWTVTQIPGLPPSPEPLSLPELAIACKLDDREVFLAGCAEIYDVFDDAVEVVREINPEAVPEDYQVPRPKEEAIGDTTSYFYSELSDAVPLKGFRPQLLVSDDAIVLGYSQRQVTDMMEPRPLTTRPAWLDDDSAVAAVSYVDLAGMVTALRPWVKFGLSLTGQPLDEPLFPQPGPIPTGNDILQIWDCMSAMGKAAGTVTVGADGPNVSRWVWVSE